MHLLKQTVTMQTEVCVNYLNCHIHVPSMHVLANSRHTYDVKIWLSRTTDNSNIFIRSREVRDNVSRLYEGCSKWIAYFYLETSNFKLAQKYSFHALEVLPVARNAKFQPMYPLLEGVTVRWFGHSNKVLMNGRSKYLLGLVFPPSKECFQFRKQKEITWGKV